MLSSNSKFILVSILWSTFLVAGCHNIDTKISYNKLLTVVSSASEPIYLSFNDNKNSSFYFLLQHDTRYQDYLLKVRWNSADKTPLFNNQQSTLKFLVDGQKVIMLTPVKPPKIVAYNLETKGHQEEAEFVLNLKQLTDIATAKSVVVELSGRYTVVVGEFNRWHTTKAFKDFLQKSYNI